MKNLIFLDIDGVLNSPGDWIEYGPCINRILVARFNKILKATDASIVISSSWRYLVGNGAMTIVGFGHMLCTHGVIGGRVIGVTCPDELVGDRSEQISYWLTSHDYHGNYVVIDDMMIEGHPFVHTDGSRGLTDEDVERTITLLNS